VERRFLLLALGPDIGAYGGMGQSFEGGAQAQIMGTAGGPAD